MASYSPPFNAYLSIWRSRQQQSDKRAAGLEREVEQCHRDMRDMGDRKRMHAAQCDREGEPALRALVEQAERDTKEANRKRRHAEAEAQTRCSGRWAKKRNFLSRP